MRDILSFLSGYFTPLICLACAVSVITFFAFCIDKVKAKNGAWRIKEKTLILLCVFFGAAGGLCGMILFRHKIRKPKFVITVPLALILQILFFVAIRTA